jgi:putative flippase GtrA
MRPNWKKSKMDNIPLSGQSETAQSKPTLAQKYGPLAAQFLRFAVVGVLNTGIDFAILNILSYLTNITEGARIIPLKGIAFLAANINSYLINKHWTFKDKSDGQGAKQFSVYLTVSIIGALINIGAVYLITTYMQPAFGMSDKLWLNVANLAATGLSLIWNFIGYKLIVFRGK